MSTIPIGGGYSAEFRKDGIAISHEDGGLHMASDPEREMVAEIQWLRHELRDTIRESQQYRAERDEVIDALRQMLHKGMIYGREHWDEVTSALAVFAKHGASDAPA